MDFILSIFRVVGLTLALLPVSLPARAAPARPGLSEKDLAPLKKVASTLRGRLACRAVQEGAAPPLENVEAAAEFAQLAGIYALIANHYPMELEGDRVSQINDLIRDASIAYERAYDCAPGEANAVYLVSAIDLLDGRLRHLVEVEYLAKDDPAVRELTERRDDLMGKLPAGHQCPVCERCDDRCPEASSATGYRGVHGERLALSVGLGGGQGFLTGPRAGKLALLTLRLAFGPRFVLGARMRHIVGAGGQYALQTVMRASEGAGPAVETPRPSALHQAGLYVEYGFAPHRHFSAHVHAALHVSAGLIWYDDGGAPASGYSFLSLNPGGGAALCTLYSALCARVHGAGSVVGRGRPTITTYDITLNLDVFRVVDAILARRAGPRT